MLDRRALDELKARIADRFTAAELVDMLDVHVESIIEEYIEKILASELLLEEVGYYEDLQDEEE